MPQTRCERPCSFQPGNFTGWGSEGVKQPKRHLKMSVQMLRYRQRLPTTEEKTNGQRLPTTEVKTNRQRLPTSEQKTEPTEAAY